MFLFSFVELANAATRMLMNGEDLRDGRSLMQKYVFNNMYTSKQGFQVSLVFFITLSEGFGRYCDSSRNKSKDYNRKNPPTQY